MSEVPLEDIRAFHRRFKSQKERVKEEQEGLKFITDEAKIRGLRPDALKSAFKLADMKPVDLKAWLDTFDHARAALGLDNQLDLEEAIEQQKQGEDAQRSMAEAVASEGFGEAMAASPAMRNVSITNADGEGHHVAEDGTVTPIRKGIPKARGRRPLH